MGRVARRIEEMNIATKTSLLIKVLIGIILVVAGVAFQPLMYIAVVYSFAIILIEKDPESVICILFALLNTAPIFKFSVGGTSVFTLIEIVAIAKLFTQRRYIESRFFVIWALYLVYMILGMGNAYADLIKCACMPLIIYMITRTLKYEQLKMVSTYYIFGVFANSVIGLLRLYIPNMQSYVSFKQQGYGYSGAALVLTDRFSGLWGDPNYYSIHLILVLSIVIVLFSRKEISAIVFYAIYVAMTVLGSLTGSKSFFLTLIVVTACAVAVLLKEKQISHSAVFIFAIAFATFLLAKGYIDVFSRVMYRLQNISALGFDTGRSDIWKSYYELYSDNFLLMLFGSGLGRGFLLRVPHNAFIDVIVLYGGIGGTIAFFAFYKAFVFCHKQRKGNVVPAFILLIMYSFLSMYYSIDAPFQIALASCLLFLRPSSAKDNEKLYKKTQFIDCEEGAL